MNLTVQCDNWYLLYGDISYWRAPADFDDDVLLAAGKFTGLGGKIGCCDCCCLGGGEGVAGGLCTGLFSAEDDDKYDDE